MLSKPDSIERIAGASTSHWPSLRRWLRYATLAMLGVMFCVTLVFWIRSYWRIDHLHGILSGEHRMFVRSGGGEIVFSEYTLLGPTPYHIPYQTWQTRSYVRGDWFNGLVENDDYGTYVAEGIASQSSSEKPVRVWWNDPVGISAQPVNPFEQPRLDISSHGIAFPHLMLLLIAGSLFFLILRRWQFSLRTFFIWVTIICVAMACAVAFSNHAKEISFIRIIS